MLHSLSQATYAHILMISHDYHMIHTNLEVVEHHKGDTEVAPGNNLPEGEERPDSTLQEGEGQHSLEVEPGHSCTGVGSSLRERRQR